MKIKIITKYLELRRIIPKFAATVPTTLPVEQRTRVGLLLFYTFMIYSKLPLDYSEILDLLVSRGLIISDRNKAIECLKVVSYFRLDNYFHPMESDKVRHIFKPGSNFENAMDLYRFDCGLRELIFTAMKTAHILVTIVPSMYAVAYIDKRCLLPSWHL